MNQIDYSIIIPHKNIPVLLQRCLDSIPQRDNIQIIIVDDNSDTSKVNFENFPGLNNPHVEVIFGKNENGRKGAGYARNLGLERAKGKWIIFADADDFFNPCFEEALDKYKDNKNDIIFFKATSIFSDTNEPCDRSEHINVPLKQIQQTNNWDLAFKIHVPWGKFMKKYIIETNNISFQEVMYSNDILFAIKLGVTMSQKKIDDSPIYCITYRENSLTGENTLESVKVRFDVICESVGYLTKNGKKNYLIKDAYERWLWIYKNNKILGIKLFPKLFSTCKFKVFNYVIWKDIYNIKSTSVWRLLRRIKRTIK